MKNFCKIACLTIAAAASLILKADYKFSAITNEATGAVATSVLVPDGSPLVTSLVLTQSVERILEVKGFTQEGYDIVSNAAMSATAAIAGLATTNDATLTPVYAPPGTGFSDWAIYREGIDVTAQVERPLIWWDDGYVIGWDYEETYIPGDHFDASTAPFVTGAYDSLSISYIGMDGNTETVHYTATRTRMAPIGYTLGDQTNKVLVSTKYTDTAIAAAATAATNYTASATNALDQFLSSQMSQLSQSLAGKASTNDVHITPVYGGNGERFSYVLGDQMGKLIQPALPYPTNAIPYQAIKGAPVITNTIVEQTEHYVVTNITNIVYLVSSYEIVTNYASMSEYTYAVTNGMCQSITLDNCESLTVVYDDAGVVNNMGTSFLFVSNSAPAWVMSVADRNPDCTVKCLEGQKLFYNGMAAGEFIFSFVKPAPNRLIVTFNKLSDF